MDHSFIREVELKSRELEIVLTKNNAYVQAIPCVGDTIGAGEVGGKHRNGPLQHVSGMNHILSLVARCQLGASFESARRGVIFHIGDFVN